MNVAQYLPCIAEVDSLLCSTQSHGRKHAVSDLHKVNSQSVADYSGASLDDDNAFH